MKQAKAVGAAEDEDVHRVWYSSYGSNLCLQRLMCYIAGGSMPTLRYACAGSADNSPPTKHCVAAIANGLTFVGQFTAWGDGGVAFVDPHGSGVVQSAALPSELLQSHPASSTESAVGTSAAQPVASHHKAAHSEEVQQLIARVAAANATSDDQRSIESDPPLTFLRAYSVTLRQFQDIVSQENANVDVAVPWEVICSLQEQGPGAHAVLLAGRYGAVVYLGDIGGEPLVTFTAPPATFQAWIAAKQENPPSEDYVGVITAGLVESGWTPDAARAYVTAKAAPARAALSAAGGVGVGCDASQWKWNE